MHLFHKTVFFHSLSEISYKYLKFFVLQWDELHRSKPDLNYEDPMDLAAIKEAQENMGDFKLKSAKDYIVPEKERVNADKKRGQLMELKEQVSLSLRLLKRVPYV